MFINVYKEFTVGDEVMVKKQILYDFIMSAFDPGSSQITPVMDYAFNKHNILTISGIEFDSTLLLPASFTFRECDGILFYGHFIKSLPMPSIISAEFFKG